MAETSRPERLTPGPADPRQPASFDPLRVARDLLRRIRVGALGTLQADGAPMTTLTTVATDMDGMPIIITSRLSAHTGNLLGDPRFSLLQSERGKGDPLAHPRLTLTGVARAVAGDDPALPRLRARFLARHPKAQIYIDFPDFLFWRLEALQLHLNGGFARAYSGEAADLMLDMDACAAMHDMEDSVLAHMNSDHAEAVVLYATRLCGMKDGPWQATGIDPEGLDLMLGDETARLLFDEMISNAAAIRPTLVALAKRARQAEQQG
jgi:heme iron utilization protein